MDNKGKGHVLVLPFPAQGHVTPMIQLSKRLMSKGVKVTLVSAFIEPGWVRVPASMAVEDISADAPQEDRDLSNIDSFVEHLHRLVGVKLPQVVDKLNNKGEAVSYLVYDSIMPWVLEIATQLGLRAAPLFTQPWAVNAIHYSLHCGLLTLPLHPLPVSIAPGFPPLDLLDLPSFTYDSASFPTMLAFLTNQFSNIQQADCILCNTFDALEHEVLTWVSTQWPVKNIGPTVPSMYTDKRIEDDTEYGISLFKAEADTYMKWLDSKADASVVYVAFGSVAPMEDEQFKEVALGLVNSNKHFLWVVRETEVKKLPQSLVEETAERGMMVSWCNQLQVLDHKAVGCFVSHCGWNSTLEAVCLGVPMVGIPLWSDQPTNAKFVADVWRVGLRARPDHNGLVTSQEIEHCITEVMDGERGLDINNNSQNWKQLAKAAVHKGGTSDNNIQDFVDNL